MNLGRLGFPLRLCSKAMQKNIQVPRGVFVASATEAQIKAVTRLGKTLM